MRTRVLKFVDGCRHLVDGFFGNAVYTINDALDGNFCMFIVFVDSVDTFFTLTTLKGLWIGSNSIGYRVFLYLYRTLLRGTLSTRTFFDSKPLYNPCFDVDSLPVYTFLHLSTNGVQNAD